MCIAIKTKQVIPVANFSLKHHLECYVYFISFGQNAFYLYLSRLKLQFEKYVVWSKNLP